MNHWTKRLLWLLLLALGGLALFRAFRTPPVLVDLATVARGTLLVSVDDDGRTRVRERFTIAAPMDGRLLRTPLRAGAQIRAGETVLAEFQPLATRLLDKRSRAEAEARVASAEAALSESKALVARAEADLDFATQDLARRKELVASGSEAQAGYDRALRDERRATESLTATRFAQEVSERQLQLARAGLMEESPGSATTETVIPLLSPIDGQILRVFEESSRPVLAGTPLFEVGDIRALEIVADYLSQEAVKVQPGMPVWIEGWGGERALEGRVRLVEPGGFTKVSALGVEQQRVNIVVEPPAAEPDAPGAAGAGERWSSDWSALQDGYRVELRIVIWAGEGVLIVPTGALYREGSAWAVFIVEAGVARRREVSLGHRNGLEAEVLDGLEPGEVVVLYPSELIEDGTEVEPR